jgi:PTH1 family peptidyl-tRNA hydrolase
VKLVAGLGNPENGYRGTRHNVGFEVVDEIARRHRLTFETSPVKAMQSRWRIDGDVVLLAKPLTYMNLSGEAVAGLSRYYKIDLSDVLVVCDDVNLPLGRLRARATGSEGGHNGLRSIAELLGTTDYARLRIGVGRGDARRDLADHVLAKFEPDEKAGIESAIARSADAVEVWIHHGVAQMMQMFNRASEAL